MSETSIPSDKLPLYSKYAREKFEAANTSLEFELTTPEPIKEITRVNKKEFTFVIPVYKIKGYKLKGLLYILPRLAATGCKIIVAEQVDEPVITPVKQLVENAPNTKYVMWPRKFESSEDKVIHRTALLNYITKYHVDTEWIWVNEANTVMNWQSIFDWIDSVYNYVQPYKIAKRTTEEETIKILNNEKVEIDYTDQQGAYLSLYGDISFIYKREKFLKDGGFDENFIGSCYEGLDLYRKLLLNSVDIQTINSQAVIIHSEKIDEEVANRVRHLHNVKLQTKFHIQATALETIDVKFLTDWRKKKPLLRHRNDMAVITCHFNWPGYKRPIANLNRFIRYMESKQIPVYGVELSLHGNFVTEGNENWLRIKCTDNNILFQKECLLNLAEKLVPDEYTKIAWFDCDVFLDNDTWYDETSFALDNHQLVQVFENAYWTTETGTVAKEAPAMCKYPPVPDSWSGHPGFGIAANRSMWAPNIGGLYPYCPLGHGDTTFLYTIFETPFQENTNIGIGLNNNSGYAPFHSWKKHIIDWAAGKLPGSGEGAGQKKLVSYVKGNCFHEWHGDIFNRSYVDRAFLMTWYNPEKHIYINEQGILELHNVPDTWLKMIQKYFMDRREDGSLLDGTIQ